MSWVAIAVGVGGAVVGYVGTQQTNKANAKIAKGSGHVDTTTTTSSDPYTTPYRQGALDSAWGALTGQNPLSGGTAAPIQGDPSARAAAPARTGKAQTWTNAKGQLMTLSGGRAVPATGGAAAAAGGGAPGGGGLPSTLAGKTGQSASTSGIIGQMQGLPGQNAGMNSAAERYSTDLLEGRSSNPLLDPAQAAANNIGEDPRLSAFQDYLMGNLGVGGAGGGGGGLTPTNFSGVYASNGHGGTVQPTSYASTTGVDAALRKMIAGEDAPGLAAQTAAIEAQVGRGRAENIKQLRARAVGSGFYGGDIYQQLEEGAVAQGDAQMAEQLAAARFGAFQNALGLGTQYDLGMADIGARDRATSASSASAADSLSVARRGQDLGALGSALQLGEEGRFGTAQGLGNLASLFSSDQKAALGGINDLAASRRGDLSAAGALSLGSDQAQNSLREAGISANASRANVNAQLGWQRQQFYDPLSRLGQFNDIMNGAFGNSGSVHTEGTDTRAGGGAGYVSPFAGALGGAAIGGQLGSTINKQKQSGG